MDNDHDDKRCLPKFPKLFTSSHRSEITLFPEFPNLRKAIQAEKQTMSSGAGQPIQPDSDAKPDSDARPEHVLQASLLSTGGGKNMV